MNYLTQGITSASHVPISVQVNVLVSGMYPGSHFMIHISLKNPLEHPMDAVE